MTKEEWSQNNKMFDIDNYFMQDMTEVDLNAAILVITKNQIINGWTARKGKQPHTHIQMILKKITQIIYDIDKSQYDIIQDYFLKI